MLTRSMPGHYVRVTPSGAKSFVVVVRDRQGERKQSWETIGKWPAYPIEKARKRAGEIIRAAREGKAAPDSFEKVAAKWRELHCEARKLRSLSEIDRFLKRMTTHGRGAISQASGEGTCQSCSTRSSQKSGPRQATYCLQVFSALANWYAARDDDYRSPIVKGMRRGKSVKRDRILEDDELRAVWKRAEANGQFGAFIRLCCLPGSGSDKIATMRWDDVSVDGVWTIATEEREKGNAGSLVLPKWRSTSSTRSHAMKSTPMSLPSRGSAHMNGWTKAKRNSMRSLRALRLGRSMIFGGPPSHLWPAPVSAQT